MAALGSIAPIEKKKRKGSSICLKCIFIYLFVFFCMMKEEREETLQVVATKLDEG